MSVRFRVKDIRLLKLQYSFIPDMELKPDCEQDDEEVPVPVELICNSNYDEEKKFLKVTLSTRLKDPKPVFTLGAEIGGLFQLDSDPAKQELDKIRHVNCPAILFPYLREVISEITRRGGFEPVYLRPMNFINAYGSTREEEGEE